jgi:hypothetical protein
MIRALGLAALAAMASATSMQTRGPPGNKGEYCLLCAFIYLLHRCCSGVIVQMFQWNWDSIAEVNPTVSYAMHVQMLYSSMITQECTQFLGPAGYGFVQSMTPRNIFGVYMP